MGPESWLHGNVSGAILGLQLSLCGVCWVGDSQVCGPAFMGDFAAACRAMTPLVEFTTKALGLKF